MRQLKYFKQNFSTQLKNICNKIVLQKNYIYLLKF